jgi:uncharacterized repeat protein (TIGR01451 family)
LFLIYYFLLSAILYNVPETIGDKEETTLKRIILIWSLLILLMPVTMLLFPAGLQAQTPKYDLSLNIFNGYPGQVTPGTDNHFILQVRNNGNTALTGIRFSASLPEGWTANFQPAEISSLGAGIINTLDVSIVPDASAEGGDYNITVIAKANETDSAASLFLQIERTISTWLWIGIGVAALVIIGFVIVFVRQGRQ